MIKMTLGLLVGTLVSCSGSAGDDKTSNTAASGPVCYLEIDIDDGLSGKSGLPLSDFEATVKYENVWYPYILAFKSDSGSNQLLDYNDIIEFSFDKQIPVNFGEEARLVFNLSYVVDEDSRLYIWEDYCTNGETKKYSEKNNPT